MNTKYPAYVIAVSENNAFYELQTNPIGGIANINRVIIALKNSNYVNQITLITNCKELTNFVSQFQINLLFYDFYFEKEKISIQEILNNFNEIPYSNSFIIINSKYPFITTEEIDKVIKNNKNKNQITFGSVNSNNDKSILFSNLENKNNIIDLKSIYFLKDIYSKDLSFSENNNFQPVNIPWSFPLLLNEIEDFNRCKRIFHAINFPKNYSINAKNLKIIFFDFDGVLTDNNLLSDKYGNEIIKSSKYDSYSFIRLKEELNIISYIITSELSETHKKRAEKIGINIIQSKCLKSQIVESILEEMGIDHNIKNKLLPKTIFVGNDVNDLTVIPVVDLFCSPSDSHPEVLQQSDFIFETKGGEGIVKELFQHLSKNFIFFANLNQNKLNETIIKNY